MQWHTVVMAMVEGGAKDDDKGKGEDKWRHSEGSMVWHW